MSSMAILIIVCIWHAIIPTISAVWGTAVAYNSDTAVVIVLGAIYVLIHIVFTFSVGIRVSAV
jgi:hypothetical protein